MIRRPPRSTLSLHDALPIFLQGRNPGALPPELQHDAEQNQRENAGNQPAVRDRKSTRLNSSHQIISYADFCLKKKKTETRKKHKRKKSNPGLRLTRTKNQHT